VQSTAAAGSRQYIGLLVFNPLDSLNEKITKKVTVSEYSVASRMTQVIIGHFGDESFQAITCTGTDRPDGGYDIR